MRGLPEAPELAEGTRLLDRYVIIDRVAGGGMASIYRATDERLQRVVCVKLLHLVLEAGSTSGSSVYQATYSHFLQEALALSRLHHPNTLKIFDFGYLEDSGRPFQISEFLDAGNLEQLVRREGPVLPSSLLSILEPIGAAVAEAHDLSIIHRDIKPSNILFARINQTLIPKLADFGIAHANPVRKKNRRRKRKIRSASSRSFLRAGPRPSSLPAARPVPRPTSTRSRSSPSSCSPAARCSRAKTCARRSPSA